jgi:hypothetical protein
MTVFGGTIESSAIRAQSLMIVNLPWWSDQSYSTGKDANKTYDDAILADLYVITYRSSFDNTTSTDMDMIANFHRVIVEIAAVGFVRGSFEISKRCLERETDNSPHDTSIADEAIAPKRNHYGMSRPRTAQIATDDSTRRDDCLSTQDDILWTSDCCSTGDFISCVLIQRSATIFFLLV